MLTPDGLFITARHCINIAFGEKDIVGNNAYDISDYGLVIYHKQQRAFDVRAVIGLSGHPDYDIAIGVAEVPIPGERDFPMTLGLGTSALGTGASVLALGYPGTEWNRAPEETPEGARSPPLARSRATRAPPVAGHLLARARALAHAAPRSRARSPRDRRDLCRRMRRRK
jgi:hypothetical protein